MNNLKLFVFVAMLGAVAMANSQAAFAYVDDIFVQEGTKAKMKMPVVTVNRKVNIDVEMIRLGDLFNGIAPEKQDEIIAYAPEPGKKTVLTAKWLNSIAIKYAVTWRASSIYDKIIVSRSSDIISEKEINEVIKEALVNQGVSGDAEVAFNKRQILIHVPTDVASEISVNSLNVAEQGQRFSAVVDVKSGDSFSKQMRISGRIFNVIDVPVLRDNMHAGDTIRKTDIEWKAVREKLIRNDTVTSEADILGMEVRRLIRKESVIRVRDVRRHVAVKKGKRVQIVLANNSMTLTVIGEALENGSVGEIVRIKNIQSKKTVYATVTGDDMVIIDAPTRPAAIKTSLIVN